MRIVNVLPYFNEEELLELRLALLKDVVDHFVICEGDRTHTGDPLDHHSAQAVVDRLGMTDRCTVTLVRLPSKEEEPNNWVRENAQRDAAAAFIARQDVVFVTDADEIPNPEFVRYYATTAWNNPTKIARIPMVFLNCRADLRVVDGNGKPRQWTAAYVCLKTHANAHGLSEIRESFTRGTKKIRFDSIFLTDGGQVLDAGWHFSWMGRLKNWATKWESYAENSGFIPGAASDVDANLFQYNPKIGEMDPLGRSDHRLSFYHWNLLPAKLFELKPVKDYLLPNTKIDHFYHQPQFGENWFTFPNLYRSMVEKAAGGAAFVEVGAWKGRSTAFMATEIANSGKDISFVAVDHWEGSVEHQQNSELKDLYQIYCKNIAPVRQYVKDLKMSSLEAATQFEDGSLDFVLIDASHEYGDAMGDIQAWLPKVKKGGILAGHDYYPNNPEFGGVKKAVDEILGSHMIRVAEDCWIHTVGEMDKNSLQYKLESYIDDPTDPERNFAMGMHYQSIGQTASAVSFFIRAAERSDDKLFQYESMIRAALCFMSQGIRGLSVRGLLHRAMTICPKRPEAYFLLARWWEREAQVESWVNCYSYASIALQICDKNVPTLRTNVDYPGWYGLLFEKAVSAWWVGLCEESRDIFLDLLKNHRLDASHRQAVINNLKFMEEKIGRKLLP